MKNSATPEKPITIDEASDLYPDEWVFMRLTAWDDHDGSIEGMVVAHSKRRGSLNRTIIKALSTAREEGAKYYLHSPNIRTWSYEEWRASIKAAHHPLGRER